MLCLIYLLFSMIFTEVESLETFSTPEEYKNFNIKFPLQQFSTA